MNSNIEVLLCTHGDFAHGIKDSIHLICGEVAFLHALGVKPEDTVETVKEGIEAFLAQASEEKTKIIITDIMGGSPTQAAFTYATRDKVLVVSGLNLALLLELILSPREDVENLVSDSIEASKQAIVLLNNLLK
jgi:fructoselysine/glucoselysine PTS system EIIA component